MKRIVFLLTAVAVAAVSCVKDDNAVTGGMDGKFTVYAAVEATRVSVGESGSGADGAGRKLSWDAGDRIMLFDNENYAELQIKDVASGAFDGSDASLANETEYYVIHAPEAATFLSGTGMTVSAPTDYTVNPANEEHLKKNIVLAGRNMVSFIDGVAQSGVTLGMRTAYLEIPLQLPADMADMDVTMLGIESSRKGYFVNCLKLDGMGGESYECLAGNRMTVRFSPALSLSSSAPSVVKLVVWMMPGVEVAAGDLFTFTLSDASNRTTVFTKPLVKLEAGKYYKVDNFSIEGETVTDFTPTAVERANSYMIHPTDGVQEVHIPVDKVNAYWGRTVKGYGNTPANTISEGNVTAWTAEVVWADFDWKAAGCTVETSNGPVGGTEDHIVVKFMPSVKTGNMVVGVRPQTATADCPEGCYLWSWHLWITDYNPDAAVPENGRTDMWEGLTRPMMDRNLGFLHNGSGRLSNDMKGILYYQWGRKDPFPANIKLWGSDGAVLAEPTDDKTPDFISRTAVFGSAVECRQGVFNPLTFYAANSDWNADGGTVTCIWSDRASAKPTASVGSEDDAKTMYDPCPPGWKLPHGAVLQTLGTSSSGAAGEADHKRGNDRGFDITAKSFFAIYSTYKTGVWYNPAGERSMIEADATPYDRFPVYIPAVGFRRGTKAEEKGGLDQYQYSALLFKNGANSTGYAYLWSSTPASGANAPALCVGQGLGTNANTYTPSMKSIGLPVRCVKAK